MRLGVLLILIMLSTPVCIAATIDRVCDGNNFCIGVGEKIFGYSNHIRAGYSVDGGKTWTKGYVVNNPGYEPGVNNISNLICSKDLQHCAISLNGESIIFGSTPLLTVTHDRGKTWTYTIPTFPSCRKPDSYPCPTATADFSVLDLACDEKFNKCAGVGFCKLCYYTGDGPEIHEVRNLSIFTVNAGASWLDSLTHPLEQGSKYNELSKVTCINDKCIATGTAEDAEKKWSTSYRSDNFGIDWFTNDQDPSIPKIKI